MKKTICICFAFLSTFALLACVGLQGGDHPKLLANADFGQYPENYDEIIKDYLRYYLVDLHRVVDLEIVKPKQSWYRPDQVMEQLIYGYETRVLFSTRNTMGGSSGIQKYYVFIRNGRVIKFGKWEDLFPNSPDRFHSMLEKMLR